MIVVAGGWGVLALNYAGPKDPVLRIALATAAAIVALAALIALALPRWRWRALIVFSLLFAALLTWFSGLTPTTEADWQPDVAKLAYATFDGDAITVHNIRNFDYRSETDYTPAWYDKRFDLRTLEGVDLVAVYWMGPAIAHTFVSFAFSGGDHLAISIETRKKKGQGYSTLQGFFRQYELIYVVADERDVIRLRTNYRHDPPEDVYVYRVQERSRTPGSVFIEYMKQINALRARAEFYNTLTSNCTTDIWLNTLVNAQHLPFSWKILASGYVPQYLYEQGRLDTRVPFPELRERAHVNARAQAADAAADFSRRIREDSPEMTTQDLESAARAAGSIRHAMLARIPTARLMAGACADARSHGAAAGQRNRHKTAAFQAPEDLPRAVRRRRAGRGPRRCDQGAGGIPHSRSTASRAPAWARWSARPMRRA